MLSNNHRILENIKGNLRMVREQLDAENRCTNKYHLTSVLINDIADRLDIGAKRYGLEVPIEEDDGRDMGLEAYEELCDAAVYLSSLTLRLTKYKGDDIELKKQIIAMNSVFFNTLYQTILFLESYGKEK
tara:strand:+ start:3204 stop:3593 length:390 start_codon:yes stop_codon:yes gene_type:complete